MMSLRRGLSSTLIVWLFATLVILVLASTNAAAAHFTQRQAGYSLDYPDAWNADQALLDVGGPLFISNFPAGGYLRGGLLPPGGMTIEVLVFPTGTDENVALVPRPATNVSRSVQAINHRGVLRADSEFPFIESAIYKETAMALRVSDTLFVVRLSYDAKTPDSVKIQAGEAALAQVVSSLQREAKQ